MTTVASSTSTSKRPKYACTRCAARKVKCNRDRPCSACVKHNAECLYSPIVPSRQKHRRVKVSVLTERLEHYEALLREQGIDVGKLPVLSNIVQDEETLPSQTLSTMPEPIPHHSGASRAHRQVPLSFVENPLWNRVVGESRDSDETTYDSSSSSGVEALNNNFAFTFSGRHKFHKKLRHPSPSHTLQLWQIFIENVDPLVKVVHVPSLYQTIRKISENTVTVPRGLQALMFAIYGCAIMSLPLDECEQRFGEVRATLLSRYISYTEISLSQAKVMSTVDLVVLQALVLHLVTVRDIYEPRANWTLTGIAIRIAQAMGLERDGTVLGLPPFETEIRRRIWWQLKLHDFRTAELCGLAKFRDLDMSSERTHWPTTVTDDQIYPGMSALPAEAAALTDMVFVCLRCEMANFAAARVASFRREGIDIRQWNLDTSVKGDLDTEKMIASLEATIETRYLRFCDPSQPLHLVAMLVARYGLNVVRFLTHHPRRWKDLSQVPTKERCMVWGISLKLLEQHNVVQSNPLIRGFAWNAAYFRQWHAFIHVLDTLRAEPVKPDASKAWRLIGEAYDHTPDMATNMKKPIHAAMANLCLKAYDVREAALQSGNTALEHTPQFITQLRQQRELAKARRNAKLKPLGGQTQGNDCNLIDAFDTDPSRETPMVSTLDTAELGLSQNMIINDADPLHLFTGFDEPQFDSLDMDLDHLLNQQNDVEADIIDWKQWDAWLTNSNLMQP